jgi:hypothetical protein
LAKRPYRFYIGRTLHTCSAVSACACALRWAADWRCCPGPHGDGCTPRPCQLPQHSTRASTGARASPHGQQQQQQSVQSNCALSLPRMHIVSQMYFHSDKPGATQRQHRALPGPVCGCACVAAPPPTNSTVPPHNLFSTPNWEQPALSLILSPSDGCRCAWLAAAQLPPVHDQLPVHCHVCMAGCCSAACHPCMTSGQLPATLAWPCTAVQQRQERLGSSSRQHVLQCYNRPAPRAAATCHPTLQAARKKTSAAVASIPHLPRPLAML